MIWQNKRLAAGALAAVLMLTTACDSFLDVKNPNNLEAEAVDEERDRTLLSQSAFQQFVSAVGEMFVYVAWFTNEARVGDTFPTRNEFGRRDVVENNTHTTNDIWNPLHSSLQFAKETARRIEPAGPTLDLARAYFTMGYSALLLGEWFCEGTIAESWTVPRGPMTTVQVLDSAIMYLTKANDIAKGLTGTEATGIAGASLVGIARAHLQAGRKTQASQIAGQVPANFVFNILHMDDPSNRALGNDIWSYSEARISLVAGDEFRSIANCGSYLPSDTSCVRSGAGADPYRPKATGDPRISYVDTGRPSQDGVLRFNRQNKYKGWGDSERLASGLEAQYIKVEADANPTAMLTFINERRAVGRQTPLAATVTDPNVLMRELMEQKTRDFWLEGKRIGDLRRHGASVVPYILPPGNTYYKSALGQVANQTCWLLPQAERFNNPNFPR